jgi:molecular chaperone GrpE (heat shock protein)
MNDIVVAVVAGAVLFFITSFVGLAVWAINARIEAAKRETAASQREAELRQQNEMLQLEARIARELVAPAVDELRELVRHLEDQLHVRAEVRSGFEGVHKKLDARLPIGNAGGGSAGVRL